MKKLIIGLVIGLMLGLSTNAFATIGDTVSAVFADFNYVVNGESKALDSPVLVYEGTSYVRTTQISNLLGYDVTYKADSRTIEFNKPEPLPVQSSAPNDQLQTNSPEQVADPTSTPNGETKQTDANAVEGSVEASMEPTATPTVTPSPSPTPKPDNTAACKAIRDDYAVQIGMAERGPGAEGPKRLKVLQLEYYRDQALATAGC